MAAGAWRDAVSHLRFWPVAVIMLVLDLWTKHWAFSSLGPQDSHAVWGGLLVFRRSLNPGALFGMGAGLWWLFIAASLLALGFVLFLFANSRSAQRSLHMALGLVLAGALGNLYDRAFVVADVLTMKDRSYRPIGVILSTEGKSFEMGVYPEKTPSYRYPKEEIVAQGRQGVVRDFIKFEGRLGGYELWPWVFNLADSSLVVGVSLLILNFWFDRRRLLHITEAETVASTR